MNRLSIDKQAQVVSLLVEGMSMRAIVRSTGVAMNTIAKLLTDMGTAASIYQDRVLTDLPTTRIEADEIWSFCYAKKKNVPEELQDTFGYGDVWTWVAIDADTKLVASWLVGERTLEDCDSFLRDVKRRLRPDTRLQLTTDGLRTYPIVVDAVWHGEIDYAVMQKQYGNAPPEEARKYSPAICTGIDVRVVSGKPEADLISTSYVERQNLTMRMGMRRFTRLTNAFSKKIEQHAADVALHFLHYNFARKHETLSKKAGRPTTPAMAAGVTDHVWTVREMCGLLDRIER